MSKATPPIFDSASHATGCQRTLLRVSPCGWRTLLTTVFGPSPTNDIAQHGTWTIVDGFVCQRDLPCFARFSAHCATRMSTCAC